MSCILLDRKLFRPPSYIFDYKMFHQEASVETIKMIKEFVANASERGVCNNIRVKFHIFIDLM